MRTSKILLTLGLAALSVGAFAQAPPPPGGPAPMPPMLLDPAMQKELHLSKTQIAKLRALLPQPPKSGSKPPVPSLRGGTPPTPPKPGVLEAKIDAILNSTQRAQLRKIRARRERLAPAPPLGAPRPPQP